MARARSYFTGYHNQNTPLEAFVNAVAGEAPIAVTGEDGREALAVALTIVRDIERSLPTLAASPAAATSRA